MNPTRGFHGAGRSHGRGRGPPVGGQSNLLASSNEIRVPMLNWSSNFTENNLRVWKEQMSAYAMHKYGHLGLIFENNEYYTPEEVEYPVNEDGTDPLSEANDPGGFKADDFRSQIKQRREHIQKMAMDRLPLYAFMYNKISPQSKTALMREPDWETVEASKDVLALWLLIQTTHLGGNGGVSGTRVIPGETARMLYKNLDATKMGEGEELSTYLKRFQVALDCYVGAEIEAPDEPTNVAIFLENLNELRFKQLKLRIKNDYHQSGIEYPQTIMEAFKRASDWELDNFLPRGLSQHNSSTTNSSFHASQQHDNRSPKKRNLEVNPHSTCNLCSGTGHFLRECPFLDDAKEMAQKKKRAKENNCLHTHSEITPQVSTDEDSLALTVNIESYDDDEFHIGNEFYPEWCGRID
jgi:hypothetical protein